MWLFSLINMGGLFMGRLRGWGLLVDWFWDIMGLFMLNFFNWGLNMGLNRDMNFLLRWKRFFSSSLFDEKRQFILRNSPIVVLIKVLEQFIELLQRNLRLLSKSYQQILNKYAAFSLVQCPTSILIILGPNLGGNFLWCRRSRTLYMHRRLFNFMYLFVLLLLFMNSLNRSLFLLHNLLNDHFDNFLRWQWLLPPRLSNKERHLLPRYSPIVVFIEVSEQLVELLLTDLGVFAEPHQQVSNELASLSLA
jgi:hypothetical protein